MILSGIRSAFSDDGIGLPCSANNDHLDPASHKFLSDCGETTFCSAPTNGTCQPRQCRRDEFPFGFTNFTALPALCQNGTYCPDEGSGCKPLLAEGGACQLDRDDQCAPPPNWIDVASNQNFNGSLCLQSTCTYAMGYLSLWFLILTMFVHDRYANMTLGQPCILDDVTYIDMGPNGEQFSNTVTRHNCQTPQFYCDASVKACVPTKTLGTSCITDQECQSVRLSIMAVPGSFANMMCISVQLRSKRCMFRPSGDSSTSGNLADRSDCFERRLWYVASADVFNS